jgi:hypothetical protein
LAHTLEDGRLLIGPPAVIDARRLAGRSAGPDPFGPPPGPGPLRPLGIELDQHATADLELAGVGRTDGPWTAYLYGPARRLAAVGVGQAFVDARVHSVGPAGITLQTDDWGKVELPLRSAGAPALPFTVSTETTRLVGPLREDGSVDYVAALDQRYGQGVDADTNAAPLLLRALGPGGLSPASQKRLGLTPLPAEGEYFRTGAGGAASGDLARLEGWDPTAFQVERQRATARAWRPDEHPLVAGWLRLNERPLALVVEATARPRYWLPLAGDDSSFAIPSLLPHREAANALIARALMKLGSGDRRAAWTDLIAAHRLGGLLGQGPTLIERLIGIAIRGIANDGVGGLLAAGPVPADEARAFVADLRALPSPRIREAIDVAERWFVLADWTKLARDVARRPFAWSSALQDIGPFDAREPPPPFPPLPASAVDWDVLLRRINRGIDAGLGDPAAQAEVDDARKEPLLDWGSLSKEARVAAFRALVEGRDPALRRRLSLALAARSDADLGRAQLSGNEAEARLRITLVGLALRVHREATGRFPDRLEDLAPGTLGPGDRPAGPRDGYFFRYQPGERGGGFALTAAPEVPDVTGVHGFCLDATGRLTSVSPAGRVQVVGGTCSVEPGERRP